MFFTQNRVFLGLKSSCFMAFSQLCECSGFCKGDLKRFFLIQYLEVMHKLVTIETLLVIIEKFGESKIFLYLNYTDLFYTLILK